MWWRTVGLLILIVWLPSCTRAWYRRSADRESYTETVQHMQSAWQVPRLDIVPASTSRLFDPTPPDHPPMPPDDPAAHDYMHRAGKLRGYKHWGKDGYSDSIENPAWQASLPLQPDGTLLLTQDQAVELGQLHSREFQNELENLYLVALALTLNRFEFDLQWFLTNNSTYEHFGTSSVPTESNTLSSRTNFGFTRSLAAGGQLLVNFANSFVWEYTGENSNVVTSGLAFTLVQPLLRGAGRDVRMESLTQGERDLLYALRDFARFRKEFYLNIATRGNGFLTLLLQLQSIRNQEANLMALEQNLRLHEALFISGEVSVVQVDQAFQSYQQGKAALTQARTNLENSLDSYKISLGLPPTVLVRLDDALLQPFQLNSNEIVDLQDQLEKLLARYRELPQAPPLPELQAGYRQLLLEYQKTMELSRTVSGEYDSWKAQGAPPNQSTEDLHREQAARELLARQLSEMERDLPLLKQRMDQDQRELSTTELTRDWERLQRRARDLIAQVAQLFVIQTQIRVSRLELPPVPYQEAAAVSFALENRLDLMNDRGRVVDSWRRIAVAANALEGVANVTVGGNVNTAPGASNPFDFSALTSSYRVGMQFEGPLNRLAERNAYRASLIAYQRARRGFMGREDQIKQAIRRDLRQLETDRVNFALARQSLIAAARQVEAARERLLLGGAANPATGTLDILNALNTLLQAKNALIAVWVSYETGRMQLLLDMEMLQLDERGLYRHDTSPAAGPGLAASPPGN